MAEVGHAVTRQALTLSDANRLVNQLYSLYEHVFQMPGGNPGVRFDQAYDLETLNPVPEWQRIYNEVKSEVRDLGLDLI